MLLDSCDLSFFFQLTDAPFFKDRRERRSHFSRLVAALY